MSSSDDQAHRYNTRAPSSLPQYAQAPSQPHCITFPYPPSSSVEVQPSRGELIFSPTLLQFTTMVEETATASSVELTAPTHVPAPWTTKCETYWLLLWLKNPLPPGIYDPVDAPSSEQSADEFAGGPGMIQIVRYLETPVGPYDEILVIPGNYIVPGGKEKGKSRLRISRIYVSQRETCYNGT